MNHAAAIANVQSGSVIGSKRATSGLAAKGGKFLPLSPCLRFIGGHFAAANEHENVINFIGQISRSIQLRPFGNSFVRQLRKLRGVAADFVPPLFAVNIELLQRDAHFLAIRINAPVLRNFFCFRLGERSAGLIRGELQHLLQGQDGLWCIDRKEFHNFFAFHSHVFKVAVPLNR